MPLDDVLDHLETSIRRDDYGTIAEILTGIAEEDLSYIPLVIDLLEHENPTVVTAASITLGNLGERAAEARPRLIELKTHDSLSVREESDKAARRIESAP